MKTPLKLGVAAFGLALAFSPLAQAVAPAVSALPQQGPVPIELKLVDADSSHYRTDPRWLSFKNRYGGTWWGPWNDVTGTVHQIMGSGIQVVAEDDTLVPAAEVDAACRSFLEMNERMFGFGDSRNLVTTSVHRDGTDTWRVWYKQLYQGIEIKDSNINLAIKKGRIILFGGESYPDVRLSAAPAVGEGEAINIVTSQLAPLVGVAPDDRVTTKLVVYPAVGESGKVTYHLAWKVDLVGGSDHSDRNVVTYVDAHTARTLQQYDAIAHYDGNAKINHDYRSVSQPNMVDDNSSFLHITVGANNGCSVYPTGNYSFSGTGAGTLSAALYENPPASCMRVNVDNRGGTDVVYTTATTGTLNFVVNTGDEASRDCFYFIPVFKEYARPVFPNATWLDGRLLCNVNLNSDCNAFWNGTSINFYPATAAAGGCNSTGRISDVIFHEFGHGMDQNGPGGSVQNAYGEYYGDQNSIIWWDDCKLGLGFYKNNPNGSLRNACIVRNYPSDMTACGTNFYCQANVNSHNSWVALQNVKANAASGTSTAKRQMIFMATVVNTQRVGPTWWSNFLAADDDDGNLGNSTPNACVVWDAFNQTGDAGAASWGTPVPTTRPPCFGSHGGGTTTGAELITGIGPSPTGAATVTEWAHDYVTKAVEFNAYGSTYGANVSSGNLNASSTWELITGAGPSSVNGPQVKAFNAATSTLVSPVVNYFAYGTLKFGVNVSAGDIDADNFGEIVTGAGPGAVFGPHVRGWNYDGTGLTAMGKVSFFAFSTLKYGCYVTSGTIDGGNRREIVVGPGPSPAFGPTVRGFVYNGTATTALSKVNFNAYTGTFYGVRPGIANYDNDAYDEILTGQGPAPANSTEVRGFNYDNATIANQFTHLAYTFPGGAIPAGGDLDAATPGAEFVVSAGGLNTPAPYNVRGFKWNGATGATQIPPDFSPYAGGSPYGSTVAIGEMGNY